MATMLPSAVVVVGGAGFLGRAIVRRWMAQLASSSESTESSPIVVSVDRRPNASADANVLVDLSNSDAVEKFVFGNYSVRAMVVAVKPPLYGPAYQDFIELNISAICELACLADKYKVRQLVYTASIACCNNWVEHTEAKESDVTSNPRLTALRSPYDLSKHVAERFILMHHKAEGMRTASVRLSGLYGDVDDPYFQRRMPLLSFDLPLDLVRPVVDSNYVENAAEALLRVVNRLGGDASVGGKFYYYTYGDRRAPHQEITAMLAEKAGKLHLGVPACLVWFSITALHAVSTVRLLLPSWPFGQPAGRAVAPKPYFSKGSWQMVAWYNQTFDNSLFRSTFGFSHVATVEEAVEEMHRRAKERGSRSVGPLPWCLCALLVASICCAVKHLYSGDCLDDVSISSMAHAGIVAASPVTHVLGKALLPAYKLWQPFQGGALHVALQATAWTLFSIICVQWLLVLLMIYSSTAEGSIGQPSAMEAMDSLVKFTDGRGKALSGVTSQLLLVLSLLVFRGPR